MEELITDVEIAQRLGVTPGRVRAIMSTRKIRRVSGYPASQVKAVRLHRGVRTEPVGSTSALTLTDTAQAIANAPTEDDRLRVFFEFMRGADEAGPAAMSLVSAEPPWTGDIRFDVLLAGTAELICARFAEPAPLWSIATDRFLDHSWWVSDLPSGRAMAALWCPGPLRRRGIYLDRRDLMSDGKHAMPDPLFGRTEVLEAFSLLAEKLHERKTVGQIHVFGGAAMLLAFNSRAVTRDIDALFGPDGPMRDAIREIAAEKGWPSTWLNDQASAYVARQPGRGPVVFDHPHLQVMTTPPEHLLAMKTLAARAVRDRKDIELLLSHLKITTGQGVWDLVSRYFPDEKIPARSKLLIEDILDRAGT